VWFALEAPSIGLTNVFAIFEAYRKVAGVNWNRWRDQSEWVAGIVRNTRANCSLIVLLRFQSAFQSLLKQMLGLFVNLLFPYPTYRQARKGGVCIADMDRLKTGNPLSYQRVLVLLVPKAGLEPLW
jgi:hypothetical protein